MSAEPTANAPKILVENIGKHFQTERGELHVLDDISLEVADGETVAIVGPSGCGKSTLLNIVGGFIEPAGGEVTIDGERVTGPDPRRIFVFQERGVFPWLTVEQNIGFGLFRQGEAEKRDRVAHYVKLVGLGGFERSYPRELSGGMKQRLEVARALAVNPDVLYLDEPFGALDSITRLQMRRELLRIWQAEKKTILFVTHNVEEAVFLGDRCCVLSRHPGRVKAMVPIPIPRSQRTWKLLASEPAFDATRQHVLKLVRAEV